MNEANARALLKKYGIAEAAWKQFAAYNDATAEFLIGQHARFAFVDTLQNLRKLVVFVDPGHAVGFPQGLLLINLNSVAGKSSVDILPANGLLRNPMLAAQLADIMVYWKASERLLLCNFVQARTRAAPGQRPADILVQVLPLANVIGLLRFDILRVLDRVTKAGDRCTINVREDNIGTLIRVDKAFPSRQFSGFTRWGPGDADDNSAATNLSNHFKKHVCNSSGQYAVEAKWWWRALEIKVRPSDLENPPASPAEAAFFAGGNLDPSRLDGFIDQVVRPRPALIDKLYGQYGTAYRDYAIKLSKELSGVVVEASAEKVMISGYAGHLTIFGRYDDYNDPASELGISSCYFVEQKNRNAKITMDKPNKLWNLK